MPEVLNEVYELFFDEDADESQIEFPIVYTNARLGTATLDLAAPGDSIRPLLDLIVEHIPAPTYTADHPLQAQVANLDASPYLGRLAVCRVREGEVARGTTVAWCRADGDDDQGPADRASRDGGAGAGRGRVGRAGRDHRRRRHRAGSRSARRSPTPTIPGRCP